jgi:hypothetical protein
MPAAVRTIHDGEPLGRIYEDASASTPDCAGSGRSRCTCTRGSGIITSGKVATLSEAKAQLEASWRAFAPSALHHIDHHAIRQDELAALAVTRGGGDVEPIEAAGATTGA